MLDDWETDEGSDSDEVIFVDYEILPDVVGITDPDADFICYDWDDDSNYDNCYYDSNGCGGGGCDEDSCDYYSIPSNMNDSWKAGCNIDGGSGACRIGEDVPSRICSSCDGIDTSTEQRTYIDAAIYYDCDNSETNRHVDSLANDDFFAVYPKKYDCDSDAGENSDDKSGTAFYDFEGDYSPSGASWVNIKSDASCPFNRLCDPDYSHTYHDDTEYTSATASMDHPCTLDDGTSSSFSCDSDDDCYSDNCGQVDEWLISCFYDRSDDWNRTLFNKADSCGGQGYLIDTSSEIKYCSTYLGNDYVCDTDLDGTFPNSYDLNDFCKKDIGKPCSQNSDCWNDNGGYDCIGGYCADCGDSYCSNPGETPSNCASDCCSADCTDIYGEGQGSGTCFSACDNYNGCDFNSTAAKTACAGQDKDSTVCVDSNTYVSCCEGTPVDCQQDYVCSNGQCVESPSADLKIVDIVPIQVVPGVEMVKDKSGIVKVLARNIGGYPAYGTVTVMYDGSPLPSDGNATQPMPVNVTKTFYFNFTPTITGNNRPINATIEVAS
ncbi:MAG: hypothetical protein ABIH76_08880 [Candidatus Bathyarchaeota archaeon]